LILRWGAPPPTNILLSGPTTESDIGTTMDEIDWEKLFWIAVDAELITELAVAPIISSSNKALFTIAAAGVLISTTTVVYLLINTSNYWKILILK